MTPTAGTPSTSSAISVAHTGTPRTKFFVPSIGSTTHCLPWNSRVPPNSSPNTESSGRCSASRARSSFSASRSASVAGVMSGLVCTRRSTAPNRCIVNASASAARSRASVRSSGGELSGVGEVSGVGDVIAVVLPCRVWWKSRSCCSSSVPSRSWRPPGSCDAAARAATGFPARYWSPASARALTASPASSTSPSPVSSTVPRSTSTWSTRDWPST